MKLTMIALVFACIVGGVSAGCYSGYSACRSACSPCVNSAVACGGAGWTCGGAGAVAVAVAPAVRTVAVAPVAVKRVVVVKVAPLYWGRWGAWSGCTVRCGTGTQTRLRACYRGHVQSAGCVGPSKEVRTCTGSPCVVAAPVVRAPVVVKKIVTKVVPAPVRVVAAAPVVATVGGCGGDILGSCGSWGAAGFCGSYPRYMASNCCGSCTGLISSYIKEDPAQQKWTDDMYVEKMNEELKKKCTDC